MIYSADDSILQLAALLLAVAIVVLLVFAILSERK